MTFYILLHRDWKDGQFETTMCGIVTKESVARAFWGEKNVVYKVTTQDICNKFTAWKPE